MTATIVSLKQTVSNGELYPLPSTCALCCYRCDVACPSLFINYLHGDIPVAATVTCAERHNHGHREMEVSPILNFDPDHLADQLLRAGHYQAAQGVGHLTSQDFSHTWRCSDEACVRHIWMPVRLLTSEPRSHLKIDMCTLTKLMMFWGTNWNILHRGTASNCIFSHHWYKNICS